MNWRIVALIIIAAAAFGVYAFGPQLSPALADEGARLNAVWAILLAALAFGWASGLRGLQPGAAARNVLIWLAIIVVIALAYRYRAALGL